MDNQAFASRHIGPNATDLKEMLMTIGVDSLNELIDKTIPKNIRLKADLDLPKAMSEYEFTNFINKLGLKNKLYKTYIGLGYHPTILPAVIQRNIFENPSWYTSYTPYQAEISQGRLEALLNFQTLVCDLTGFSLANSSLLDEATSAAEAMIMLFNARSRTQIKDGVNQFLVSDEVLPQTKSVLETRSAPLGIELVYGNFNTVELTSKMYGCILQYPGKYGQVNHYQTFIETAHQKALKVIMAADLLSLVMLKTPAELGADVAVGTSQRFGIPLGYGGPHAGYFATSDAYKRQIPGRIIGISKDAQGNRALRMALQTREQHIKREKATSNICTAQVFLAVMAGMYGVYHGADGLKRIAKKIHSLANILNEAVLKMGLNQLNSAYFDTLQIKISDSAKLKTLAEQHELNFLIIDNTTVGISLNETTSLDDVKQIITVLAKAEGKTAPNITDYFETTSIPPQLKRTSSFLNNEVFNNYHSETEMMRYLKTLEKKDISLTNSMISLGSCTMKLNAATEMLPLSSANWNSIHPFVPTNQAEGYQELLKDLEHSLNVITGFSATSLQPNSGAQGEYSGLMTIRAYHLSRGDAHRKIVLIPSSAHGTNPASAVMAGMEVIVTKTTPEGNIDVEDIREKALFYKANLAALMVTYPSTHGVFETSITEITNIIHLNGGQVYMDGANMNAQVGLTNPATIGADVCHLNLHKTFAIPHGGGGPGVGPICVASHLAPFLPTNAIVKIGGNQAIPGVSAAPWGSALVDLIAYAYIKMLGSEGLKSATSYAILNANYLKAALKDDFKTLYSGENGFVGHEMILDFRAIKPDYGVDVTDVSKRLMDFGYHAPTLSFPVHDTLMIEPTESENKAELDKFIATIKCIKQEILAYQKDEDSALKNAPHTEAMVTSDEWPFTYGRQHAAFPLEFIKRSKFWPSVSRVDDGYGDRNLICTCNPIEDYMN